MLKEIYMKTSAGPFLNSNEDFAYYNLKENFFAVVDGYGGPGRGDVLAKGLPNMILESFKNLTSSEDKTQPFYFSKRYSFISNALINAIIDVNKKTFQENMVSDSNNKCGASVISCFIKDKKMISLSAGNCLMFRLRNCKIDYIQAPDSLTSFCPHNGGFPSHIIPWSGIGLYPESFYQLKELNLKENDIFLLVSDGAVTKLTLSLIESILTKSLSSSQIINQLFDLANENGNTDNQSAILIKF